MAKNKSVYEIMGDTSNLIQPDEYEVHASANPQDHYVAPKSEAVLAAESRDLKKAKTLGAIVQTVGGTLKAAGQVKSQYDQNRIKVETHQANALGLKDQHTWDAWKLYNQDDYNSMSVPERNAERERFFTDTFNYLSGAHKDVLMSFQSKYAQNEYNENKAMEEQDFERWVSTQEEPEFAQLIAMGSGVQQADYNLKVNNAITRIHELTGLSYKELNKRFATRGVARIAQDDPRLYEWAVSQKVYSTQENVDSGLAKLATQQFDRFETKNLKEEREDEADQLSTLWETYSTPIVNDAGERTGTIYDAANIKAATIAWQIQNERKEGQGFAALIQTAAAQVAHGNNDLFAVIENMTDHTGGKLFERPLYAKDVKALLTAKQTYDSKVLPKIKKTAVVQSATALVKEYWVKGGSDLTLFNDRDFGEDFDYLSPITMDNAVLAPAKQAILSHERGKLDELAAAVQSATTNDMKIAAVQEFEEYERNVMERYQAAGIHSKTWETKLRTGSQVLVNGDPAETKVDDVRETLRLWRKLTSISSQYAGFLNPSAKKTMESLVEVLNNSTDTPDTATDNELIAAIEIVTKNPVEISEKDREWVAKKIDVMMADAGEEHLFIFNNDASIGTGYALGAIEEEIVSRMQRGSSKEEALKTIMGNQGIMGGIDPNSWFSKHFKVIHTQDEAAAGWSGYIPLWGEDFRHIVDKRPFVHFNAINGVNPRKAEAYIDRLSEYLEYKSSLIDGNSSLDIQLTIIPRGNDLQDGYMLSDQGGDPQVDEDNNIIMFDIAEFYRWSDDPNN